MERTIGENVAQVNKLFSYNRGLGLSSHDIPINESAQKSRKSERQIERNVI
jgi:hypothetical protein